MNLYLVGARVRIVDGPQAGHVGRVTTPPHPKLSGYRTVELEGPRTLHRIPTDALAPFTEESQMQQTTEVQRLAAEPETVVAKPAGIISPFGEEFDDGWKIKSVDDVDWALECYADYEHKITEAKELEAAAIARIKARTAKLVASAERGRSFFEGKLQEYAEGHRGELVKGKSKSKKFIHGSIGWKKSGGQPVKKDEAALLDWARAQPAETDFLKIEESPNWALIKKHVSESGEVIPGVEIEPETEKFFVKAE